MTDDAPETPETTPETTPKDAAANSAAPAPEAGGERIAKAMARAGVASRREAERMIIEGRVKVNGRAISSPALDVTAADKIVIDGKPMDAPQETRLWLYYKPLGLVTTESDEKGRQTVFDALPRDLPRVMTVGRLDLNSEGLLLLTNDGELKRRLELPSTGWLRRYRVRVNGVPTELTFDPLRRGITIDGEDFAPMEVRLDSQQGANAWLTVGIREGKNREIRRAMSQIGLQVNRLIRIGYGPFKLTGLEENEVREIKRRVLRDQLGGLFTGDESEAPRANNARRAAGTKPFADRSARAEADADAPRKPRHKRAEGEAPRRSFGEGDTRGPRRDGDTPRPRRSFGEGDTRGPRRDGDAPRPRRSFGDRPDSGGRGERFEKPARGERPSRFERPERPERGERPARFERADRPERTPRPPRGEEGTARRSFGAKPARDGDGARFGGPRKDGPRKDGPRKDGTRKDGPRPDGARYGADRAEGARKFAPRGDRDPAGASGGPRKGSYAGGRDGGKAGDAPRSFGGPKGAARGGKPGSYGPKTGEGRSAGKSGGYGASGPRGPRPAGNGGKPGGKPGPRPGGAPRRPRGEG